LKNLSEPLSDEELDRLNAFLLERVPEERDDEDFDCGIIDVSELDGFLTAIVSGPNTIAPSAWLPALWGEEEPVWNSAEEFQEMFGLLVRHMNGIAELLELADDSFEPMFNESRVSGKAALIVDEWCCGYVRAIALDIDAWAQGEPDLIESLKPIRYFGTEPGWEELKGMSEAEVVRQQAAIPAAARAIYAYWLERRRPREEPIRRSTAKVGRNDPCPCGSGKKYKHCCLQ
jgi:uncharacterized protein